MIKKLAIIIILVGSIILVVPIFLLIVEAVFGGYHNSILANIISELSD